MDQGLTTAVGKIIPRGPAGYATRSTEGPCRAASARQWSARVQRSLR